MKTPRYLGYTDFSGNLGITYKQYLQQREFSDGIQSSIESGTRSLVEKDDQLIAAVREGAQQSNENLVEIKMSLHEVKAEVAQGFEYAIDVLKKGFGGMILQLSQTNETLTSLLEAAKTPAQTWAIEQYLLAEDANRRGLFPEAIDALERAIAGHGSNVGYGTDHRFHFLKGVIRLGDQPGAGAMVDLPQAEASFLAAKRYAGPDKPREAAAALLLAGRAAYVQLEPERAEAHLRQIARPASHA